VATVQQSPYIAIEGSFADYLAHRDTRWIRQLEKRRTRLAARGELRLDIHDGSTHLIEHTAEAFRIEAIGWKTDNGTAIVSSSRTETFYRAVMQWAATRGILRIAILSLNGQGIAADISLEDAGVHYFLKTGFDPQYREFAPGLILRHDMIRRAFDVGLSSYEMTGSEEPYKMRWTDTTRRISTIRTYPRTLVGWSTRRTHHGLTLAQRAGSRAKRELRRATRTLSAASGE
jgi:CelD/BcsL family acetyltransferase involved in cellulose biosynthesis